MFTGTDITASYIELLKIDHRVAMLIFDVHAAENDTLHQTNTHPLNSNLCIHGRTQVAGDSSAQPGLNSINLKYKESNTEQEEKNAQ